MKHVLNISRWSISAILGTCLILLAATSNPQNPPSGPGGCTKCKNDPPPLGSFGLTLGGSSNCPVVFTWGGLDGICDEICNEQAGCKFFLATDCSGLGTNCCRVVGYTLSGVVDAWFCDGNVHQIGPDFSCGSGDHLVTLGVGTMGPDCGGIPETSNALLFSCNPCE